MNNQTYEEYWKITNAFTDYNGDKFLNALRICLDFIDEYKNEKYSEEKYKRLQTLLIEDRNMNGASVRKVINQLVKFGFIEPYLVSYTEEARDYLEAKTNRKRRSLLSKIVYSNSGFYKSVSNKSDLHQISFLVNTMVEVGELSKEDITALMLVDMENLNKDYLDRKELLTYVAKSQEIDFVGRKYNQISHLMNLLGKLDDIIFVDNKLYFTEDAKQIFGEKLEKETRKRNPYLHLIYKNQLKEESYSVFSIEKCMVEKRAYPTLIASHIKPFVQSSDKEAYDPNNGILLSQNLDGLFDKGKISFEDDGTVITSSELDEELKEYLETYRLDDVFLKEGRKQYLIFHREYFKDKLK
ncbi:MAG: HNH endonuclease signature motif containing protein [Patescibacteria group bacterium]